MPQLFVFILLFVLWGCGAVNSGDSDQKTIKIACAANMQFAMDSIAVLFEEEHQIKCDITPGSSGMLTSQIDNGAPYDVFVSANMKYPETVFQNGNGEKPVVYARGRLVLVVNKNATYASLDEALKDENLLRIGIADHHTAPYGMAANQYLTETGKINALKNKLVAGESIGQVNQYLTTGAVDAAFTSYSFKVKNENAFNFLEVNTTLFDPIHQGAMILDHGLRHNNDEAKTLMDFLASPKCKEVLNYFGYLTD